MSGFTTTIASWLPETSAVSILLAPWLVWLAHRVICLIELRMILRSLPREDRVTAAVAYVSTRPSHVPIAPGVSHRIPERVCLPYPPDESNRPARDKS